ncbi:MAG: carbon storage regulator CsrA [Bacillota bacterium]|nr:carbon storage regulator CsrA [Bacillota bacterium]
MLVLTRKRNQSIIIGDEVEVTVLEVRGDQVRLGINAPRRVSVHRREVYDEIQLANQEAARSRRGLARALDFLKRN